MTDGPVEAAFTVMSDFENYKSGIYKSTSSKELGAYVKLLLVVFCLLLMFDSLENYYFFFFFFLSPLPYTSFPTKTKVDMPFVLLDGVLRVVLIIGKLQTPGILFGVKKVILELCVAQMSVVSKMMSLLRRLALHGLDQDLNQHPSQHQHLEIVVIKHLK